MQYNNLVVFDFETGGIDTKACEIVQVAALAINPRNLTVYPGSEFDSLMRPLEPEKVQDEALAVNGKTREMLAEAPHPEEVWHRFADWVKQWCRNGKNDGFNSPISCGHNHLGFDWPIMLRYAERYKTQRYNARMGVWEQSLFQPVVKYDTMLMLASWAENMKEPAKLNLDYLRRYFSMRAPEGGPNAHDALRDVRDTAAILIKLLKLQRELAPKVIWEKAFDEEFVAAEIARRKEAKSRKKVVA